MVQARFEGLQEKLPYVASAELGEVANNALTFLISEDNQQCLIFGKGCKKNEQKALQIIDRFLQTPSVKPHFEKAAINSRAIAAEKVLRDKYDISDDQFALFGKPILALKEQGYLESNWGDRQLKQIASNADYGKIMQNKDLLDYIAHLYFDQMPNREIREHMLVLLNPKIAPRPTALDIAGKWTLQKGKWLWQKGGEGVKRAKAWYKKTEKLPLPQEQPEHTPHTFKEGGQFE